ncbi:hypothetical protein [Spirosoma sp. KNUC1025]|uniref:hypothetical protein n=1 Tax=Spirosoma sp. KNUC1025 TaxID=2894082 RepID=UPI00386EBD31|nr:hypothetical protein LN737_06260 [Spirosoma sp. KNUC1025]
METLYNWLLQNTGNAGNFYTILNTERDKAGLLEVMARSSDFKIMNLFIYDGQTAESAENRLHAIPDESPTSNYVFGSEQQVIDFLAEGKASESESSGTATSIHVVLAEPTSETGTVTFPPEQA